MADTGGQHDAIGSAVRPGWSRGREFSFELPMPPSANTYYRVANNIVHISRKAREYRNEVLNTIQFRADFPLECRVAVDVLLNFGTRRRCDVDNRLKPLLDAIQHARVFEDDSQVDALRVTRGSVRPGGRCVVTVTELLPDVEQGELPL